MRREKCGPTNLMKGKERERKRKRKEERERTCARLINCSFRLSSLLSESEIESNDQDDKGDFHLKV